MPEAKITTLGDFTKRVGQCRKQWNLDSHPHKELWFRGESTKYETPLCPELYRPVRKGLNNPIALLIKMENDLYEEFQRCAVQLSNEKRAEDEDWDSYFLMRHHGAPTRLLDWSDGALIALHFALRGKREDEGDPVIYVLEPDRLRDEQLGTLPDTAIAKAAWQDYLKKYPSEHFDEEQWERAYLPADEDDLKELIIPAPPLLLHFSHITRRVAAQRSRFMVFGTDPGWLAQRVGTTGFPVETIIIDANASSEIRRELRDAGITESVIFPDLDGLGRELRQLWEDRNLLGY
jgi:hypothetical protein